MEIPALQRELMSKSKQADLPIPSKLPMGWSEGKSWFLAHGHCLTGTRIKAWASYLSPYPGQRQRSRPMETILGKQSLAQQSPRVTGMGHSGSWLELPKASVWVHSPSCRTQKSSKEKIKTTPR